jgi:hypothetical protein
MTDWDQLLQGFDRPEPTPEQRPDEPEVSLELDVLREKRARRQDRRWFNAAELDRLVRERRGDR